MRVHSLIFFYPIGREQGYQTFVVQLSFRNIIAIDQQRTIKEPVGMVIHEISVKQKSSLFALLHEPIPSLPLVNAIWQYCHFPILYSEVLRV